MQASLSGSLSLPSTVTPLETKIFQNKTQDGLANVDSRLLAVIYRRWKMGISNCHRFNVLGVGGHWGE